MGTDIHKLSFLRDLLKMPLSDGLNRRIFLPPEISQGLILRTQTPAAQSEKNEEELGKLSLDQIKQLETEAPTKQNNPIINLDTLLAELEAANINTHEKSITSLIETSISEQEKPSEDKSTDKPKPSLEQVMGTAVPIFMPLPGLLLNIINTAQQGSDAEKNKQDKSKNQNGETEDFTDSPSTEKTTTNLWDSLTAVFKPITEPLAQIWSNTKKKIGIENFSDLFSQPFADRVKDFIESFNDKNSEIKQSSQEAESLRTLTQNKPSDEAKRLEQLEEEQRYIARLEQQRREDAAREAKAYAEKQAQEVQARVDLEKQISEQREVNKSTNLDLASTSKSQGNISELPENVQKMIKLANIFGLTIDINSLALNASQDDALKKINTEILLNPGAGLNYLAAMGKNLSPAFDRMVTSANSASISNLLLNKYLTSGSDIPTLNKDLNEYLSQQQGTTSLSKA